METLVLDHAGQTFLVGQATMLSPQAVADRADLADSGWDVQDANPYITWIEGDFVEGDKPNSNKQFWTAGDLEMAEYSIRYAPLNMIHKWREPVGFYVATRNVPLQPRLSLASLDVEDPADLAEDMELLTDLLDDAKKGGSHAPYKIVKVGKKFQVVNNIGEVKATFKTRSAALAYQRALYRNVPGAAKKAEKTKWKGDKAEYDEPGSMKITALAGLWSHIFPMEAKVVERASDEGTLFYSMECTGSHLTCAGEEGCGQTFEYTKPETHCAHLLGRTSIRHIVNPVFRGGALIIPPVKPGWKGARASILSEAVMTEAAAFAEASQEQYTTLRSNGVDLTASAWEHLMGLVIANANQS